MKRAVKQEKRSRLINNNIDLKAKRILNFMVLCNRRDLQEKKMKSKEQEPKMLKVKKKLLI